MRSYYSVERTADGSLVHRIWDDDLEPRRGRKSNTRSVDSGTSHTRQQATGRPEPIKPVPIEPREPPPAPSPPPAIGFAEYNNLTKDMLKDKLNDSILRASVIYKENVALWNTANKYAERIQELEAKVAKLSHN